MSARDVPALLFCVWGHCISPMHEVMPRVVAIAVSMLMAKWMIFCQSSFFINKKIFFLVIQMTGGRKDLVADIGISVMPSLKGTTFCTLPIDDLLMWNEYRDW